MAAIRTTEYAVRALVALALEGQGGGVKRASALAQVSGTPGKFMEQVLRLLRQGGFVASRRGSGGGYGLARSAEKIRMSDVVAWVDGRGQGREAGRGDAVGEVWGKLQRDAARAASSVLAEETLGRLVERVKAKSAAKGRTTEYQI
ncbi:MAG: Rrf2 family transcriptional regulator [Verrucomicrobia bacterium]|nr:Rrf2 family transcriptional regulator [Verrucomicrobiota bacterium]NBS79015.1 Rrf2 family transcriptional regulator [bacterium]NBV96539.1 Rrf2 family transcriptional regulator [Verrucomicrobiota bacterium]